jgi:hsp70-interacting protein
MQVLLSSESVDARLQKKALYLLAELAEQQVEMEGQISNGLDDKLLLSIVKLAEATDLDTQEKVGFDEDFQSVELGSCKYR